MRGVWRGRLLCAEKSEGLIHVHLLDGFKQFIKVIVKQLARW